MKTVTVKDRELLVRMNDDVVVIVMSVAGQTRYVTDDAVVTETGNDAIRPSSSWIGHMAVPDAPADADQPGSE